MNRLFFFLILSIPVILVSWKCLSNIKNHGFFRFFAWECILWLFATNYRTWFTDPFSTPQVISWLLLLISIYLVIAGVVKMHRTGQPDKSRTEDHLFEFEKTTKLVDSGIFRYIRHPLYSSLVFLTWAILLKGFSVELLIVSMVSTIMLYLTARYDEKECIAFFGDKYIDYMKRTRMFIPFVF